MKIKTPKVSVLMPVYKTNEAYLREAIESILQQTFKNFEFLILDDCPEDDREAIVKSYDDVRIKYFKNKDNLGITLSRNKLISMSKGKYLAVFDHDDISLPNRLEKEVNYLDAHPEVGVVGCKVKTIIKKRMLKTPINDNDIKMSLIRDCAVIHPASMIRKSVLVDNNIYYEEQFSPSEDYALWCRLIPYTKFYNIPEILFYYRDHSENTSHKQGKKMRLATRAIRSFVKVDNKALYENFIFNSIRTIKIKLFGFLPFVKVIIRENVAKVYVFGIIICSIKIATRVDVK